MITRKLLLVSPDPELVAAVGRGLSGVKTRGSVAVLRQYPSAEQLQQVLGAEQPSLVIVGLSDPETALKVIEQLSSAYPGIVAAAHTICASELILASLRAGARDYVGPPFEPDALESLLRLRPGDTKGRHPGRLICFLPARGGCGGSTVALHVASAIARESGRRVLLLDLDFHAGTVDLRLGLKPKFTLVDAVHHLSDLDELWGQLTCSWGGVEILAPPPNAFPVDPVLVKQIPLVVESGTRAYEWVLCDLPAAVHASAADVVLQAEAVYLVSTPELASLQLARRRVQELRELDIPLEAVRLVLNRVGGGSLSTAQEMAKIVGTAVGGVLENDYTGVNAAMLKGHLVSPQSRLGKQFSTFARQIIGLPAAKAPNGFQWRGLLSRLGASLLPASSAPKSDENPPRAGNPSDAEEACSTEPRA